MFLIGLPLLLAFSKKSNPCFIKAKMLRELNNTSYIFIAHELFRKPIIKTKLKSPFKAV